MPGISGLMLRLLLSETLPDILRIQGLRDNVMATSFQLVTFYILLCPALLK